MSDKLEEKIKELEDKIIYSRYSLNHDLHEMKFELGFRIEELEKKIKVLEESNEVRDKKSSK